MDFESQIEKIAKDIRDREDREMALAFTNVVCSLLRKNGVFVKTSRYELETDNETDKNKYIIKKKYGVYFDGLDFTEHDKRFKDEIEDLRKKLRESKDYITQLKHELQKKCSFETDRLVKLPFDPLETANMLINATYKDEIQILERQVDRDLCNIDDLEQIAEHLLVYCKHNREDEG